MCRMDSLGVARESQQELSAKLQKNITPQASITILSNLHSSLSVSDLPCVLYRSYDENFLR